MLDNSAISELLAGASENESEHRQRALRRAARRALMWPEEASDLVATERPLTHLSGVGPWVDRIIRQWMTDDVEPPVPPPIREGFLTLAAARKVLRQSPPLPECDLQVHTTYSDGSAPVRTMVEKAAELGYRYVGITDHSKGLPIARGMHEDRLAMQAREIDAINTEAVLPPIVHSIEMNVSVSGEGDMEKDALAPLGYVLGAFHSRLRVTEDQTERYLAAMRNPWVDVLAHPRGRIFNSRLGLQANWAAVFEAAVQTGTALECDCYPDRQDLNVELLREAGRAGVTISVGTDAHDPDEMEFMEIGRAAIALAGVPRAQVLNLMPLVRFEAWSSQRRSQRV